MKKLIFKTGFCLFITLSIFTFPTMGYGQQNEGLASIRDSSSDNPLNPAVRKGHFGKARTHSGQNDLMVIYLTAPSQSTDELLKATRTIHNQFKTSEYHIDVVVFYNITDEIEGIWGSVLMNGDQFKLKSGSSHFAFETIEKYVGALSKYYLKNYSENP